MFADTEAKLVKLWKQKILGELSLRVEYDTIKNDLTNKNVNYSFMTDQCNKAFMDKDQLVQAVVRGEGAFKHYDNMMDGRIEWNKTALRAWLQDYAEIQHLSPSSMNRSTQSWNGIDNPDVPQYHDMSHMQPGHIGQAPHNPLSIHENHSTHWT